MTRFDRWKSTLHRRWMRSLDEYDCTLDQPLSTGQLALMCGCSRKTIQRIVKGRRGKRLGITAKEFTSLLT